MLTKAEALASHPAITYTTGDLDIIEQSKGSYDLVYNSLAFHYLTNLKELFIEVYDRLDSEILRSIN